MSPTMQVLTGSPTPDEAAAVTAAVQVLLDAEAGPPAEPPWPYRSAWRRTAIDEATCSAHESRGADVP